jgi:RNA polymerase sigma-70 factor (ECF subfamily)
MPEWAELVKAAQAGDRDAFGVLLDGQARSAYRVSQVIVRNQAMAQDAVQEASIRAWRDITGLRDAERWPQWFRRLVVRSAIDQTRRESRHRRSTPFAATMQTDDPASAITERDELRAALLTLSADDRAILALRFAADLEVPDIADSLAIPLGTAKSRLHRALARLRQALEEHR